eukprot:273762-Pyramimonas_sp.AAC.1
MKNGCAMVLGGAHSTHGLRRVPHHGDWWCHCCQEKSPLHQPQAVKRRRAALVQSTLRWRCAEQGMRGGRGGERVRGEPSDTRKGREQLTGRGLEGVERCCRALPLSLYGPHPK